MAKYFLTVLVAVALVTVATTVTAADKLEGELVSVQIKVDGQGAARMFAPNDVPPVQFGGLDDTTIFYRYAHLEVGDVYSIDVSPHNNRQRFGVGIAVDGQFIAHKGAVPSDVSVPEAWGKRFGAAYVIGQGAGHEFRGWRETAGTGGTIRRFEVTKAKDSLAVKISNDATAMRTIAIAVFREDYSPYMNSPELGSARGVGEKGIDIGTGIGERERSDTVSTVFKPKTLAWEVFVIRYGTKAELKQLGVWEDPTPPTPRNRLWPAPVAPGYGRLPE